MKLIKIHFPGKLVFGEDSLEEFINFFLEQDYRNLFIIADPNVRKPVEEITTSLSSKGISCTINSDISNEPTVSDFNKLRDKAKTGNVDSVIGIGGGSVLDTAKLIAALAHSGQKVENAFGIGKIGPRNLFLACLPTTAGTGSEVSPNAILLDEKENLKKGIVSPFLIPDASFIDPTLTCTVPPKVTAATGIDALTHCIEAFTNKFSHPVIDLYALEGIRLIYNNLEAAFSDGSNREARSKMALGSMYGGLCLGPVNTAAVHALSYPLGSEYHIPHGVANALLLSSVMQANIPDATEKYAKIAEAIGVGNSGTEMEKAEKGVQMIGELCRKIGIPGNLREYNVPESEIPAMAASAIKIQRLLKNNPKKLSEEDIRNIYKNLF